MRAVTGLRARSIEGSVAGSEAGLEVGPVVGPLVLGPSRIGGDVVGSQTLGAQLSAKDRTAFVGRAAEPMAIEALLVDDPPASVMLLHGPGGIGKSALLREVARRAEQAGWSVLRVDGRDLAPAPAEVDEAIAPARAAPRPLVLVDGYEHLTALGAHLRRAVLPGLPERAVDVIAGRCQPEPAWFAGGDSPVLLTQRPSHTTKGGTS